MREGGAIKRSCGEAFAEGGGGGGAAFNTASEAAGSFASTAEFRKHQEAFDELNSQIEVLWQEMEELEKKEEEASGKPLLPLDLRPEISPEIYALTQKIENLRRQKAQHAHFLFSEHQTPDLLNRRQAIVDCKEAIEACQETLKKLSADLKHFEAEVQACERRMQESQQAIATLRNEIVRRETSILALPEEEKLTEAQRTEFTAHQEAVSIMEKALPPHQEEIFKLQIKLDEYISEIDVRNSEEIELREKVSRLKVEIGTHAGEISKLVEKEADKTAHTSRIFKRKTETKAVRFDVSLSPPPSKKMRGSAESPW